MQVSALSPGTQSLVDGLTARKYAALRLAPLESGYRDPVLDNIAPPSNASTRELCRALWAQGFSVEYLEHRFGIPRIGATQ